MKKTLIIFLLSIAVLAGCKKEEPYNKIPADLLIAGYLPSWGMDNIDLNMLDDLDIVYYFSITPDQEGGFYIPEGMDDNITIIKNQIEGSGTRLFIVIGGYYESKYIFPMAEDPDKRISYVTNLMQFCRERHIDGVDLDWEGYPEPITHDDFISLINTLSDSTKANNMMFSVAMTASESEYTASFQEQIDYVNVMTYGFFDNEGNQVPLDMFADYTYRYVSAGVPKEKIIMGVPFYAKRPYVEGDTSPRYYVYRDIVELTMPEPSSNNYGVYSYNGRDLLRAKTNFLIRYGTGGIMAWELSMDVALNSPYSLMAAILSEAGR